MIMTTSFRTPKDSTGRKKKANISLSWTLSKHDILLIFIHASSTQARQRIGHREALFFAERFSSRFMERISPQGEAPQSVNALCLKSNAIFSLLEVESF